jgi:tetratricopeptide (TPR) repeat protein
MPRKLTAYDFALWAALPMAKSSRIEGRLKMILNSNTRPRALPRHFLGYALMVGAAMVVPLALLHPAARAQSAPLPAKKPHLSKAMAQVSAVSAIPGETDAIELARKGRSLTPQAAAELERKIAAHPDDYIAHILLLCYDETKSYKAGPGRTAYQQQVFWLIRKHPESVMNGANTMLLKRDDANAFEQGKTLWLEQIAAQPTNTVILGKAASYCLISDNQTAERLLRQAETLEPKNPHWPERIGFLYQLQAENSSGEIKRSLASKALTEYEAAAEISTNKSLQHSTSADLARTAFDAGEYDKARHYATLLLRRSLNKNGESWTPSGDTHQAHLILGRLALRDGDMAQAEQHLLAMGRISDSPSLASFGPNMQLAKELLDKGDRRPVLAYLDEFVPLRKIDHHHLGLWKAQIQQGKTPDFGANLVY